MNLTENKTHPISNKIFKDVNIKYLAQVIQEEYNNAIKGKTSYTIKEQNIVIDFYVKCTGNNSFHAGSSEILMMTVKFIKSLFFILK